jgi:hypothetical protein
MIAEGTPGSMIGLNENTGAGGRGLSSAEVFKDMTVIPRQLYYARRLNKLFRLGLGVLNARFEYQEYDVRDSLTIAQILQLMLTQGAITINEARDTLGMSAIKGGDVAFVRIKEGGAIKVEDLPELEMQLQEAEKTGPPKDIDLELAPSIGDNTQDMLKKAEEANQTSIN